jgi:ferrous iron transport protein A
LYHWILAGCRIISLSKRDPDRFPAFSSLIKTIHRSDEMDSGVCQAVQPGLVRLRKPPFPGGQTMGWLKSKNLEIRVCNPDRNGRILNCDHSGRSLNSGLRQNLLPFRRGQGVRRVSVLSELKVGETSVLVALDLPESVQNHLMHMGFVPDAMVTALRRAPAGDPTVYLIDGMEIALRHETAESIRVRAPKIDAKQDVKSPKATTVSGSVLVEASR